MSMVINNGNVKTEEDALLKNIRELSKHKPQEARKRELADFYIRDYEDIKNNTYEVL